MAKSKGPIDQLLHGSPQAVSMHVDELFLNVEGHAVLHYRGTLALITQTDWGTVEQTPAVMLFHTDRGELERALLDQYRYLALIGRELEARKELQGDDT